jgi:molybdenum cofactor cytidylyltransferase
VGTPRRGGRISTGIALRRALRLEGQEVVAFVGAGGKTSAMFRLAAEIAAAGGRVVTTTTTRIFAAQLALAPAHFESGRATDGELSAALEQHGHILVTGPVDAEAGKATAAPLELIGRLLGLPGRPVVLIEADGARMRPFKAPAEHEPVVPPQTTLLAPVVGADIFGQPLDDTRVHRASRAAELAGVPLGAPVTPEIVARVLASPLGGLKNLPDGARVIPLINKIEDPAALEAARETAQRLLSYPRIHSVVLGALRMEPPVREAHGRVAAVVLAAGSSSRMGQAKQLLAWPRGGTVLGAVVQRLQASGVSEVVVVVGQGREAVQAAVTAAARPDGPPVRTVFNLDFAVAEMARSLAVGLEALPANCLAALVALGDQPQMRPEVVATLMGRWRSTQAPVVAPFFEGQRGHPLLFDLAIWEAVRALPASANPRQAVQAAGQVERVDVEDDSILRDMDTPEAYARELARATGIID